MEEEVPHQEVEVVEEDQSLEGEEGEVGWSQVDQEEVEVEEVGVEQFQTDPEEEAVVEEVEGVHLYFQAEEGVEVLMKWEEEEGEVQRLHRPWLQD